MTRLYGFRIKTQASGEASFGPQISCSNRLPMSQNYPWRCDEADSGICIFYRLPYSDKAIAQTVLGEPRWARESRDGNQ